jgi:hypothetical protein
MKFPDRVKYKQAIMVYKSINNICPEYLKQKFTFNHTIHSRTLRSTDSKLNIYQPKPKVEFFRKSFNYSGSKIWNEIPISIRSAQSLQNFKHKYIENWKKTNQI